MARRFHPDNNYGFVTTEIMTMINTAKYGLRDQLHENDEPRGKERVQAAEDESSIPSDQNLTLKIIKTLINWVQNMEVNPLVCIDI